MKMNKILRPSVGADVSAFRGGFDIQMYVLNIIIAPPRRIYAGKYT
jgi:hypothetical protein